MIILAKCALASPDTWFAGGLTFREGVIKIGVAHNRDGGSPSHFWVPAAERAGGMAMNFVPKTPFTISPPRLPIVCRAANVTRRLSYRTPPSSDGQAGRDHVAFATVGRKFRSMSVNAKKNVHVAVPTLHGQRRRQSTSADASGV